jgi:L-lactate utilization protein LutC
VYANQSKTLDKIGLTAEFDKSGRYNAVRPKVLSLDRKTQAKEIRKLRSSPDYIVGSVHAITEPGQVLTASGGGSQLAPYAYGAAKVIWVVGAQKIVRDLNEVSAASRNTAIHWRMPVCMRRTTRTVRSTRL